MYELIIPSVARKHRQPPPRRYGPLCCAVLPPEFHAMSLRLQAVCVPGSPSSRRPPSDRVCHTSDTLCTCFTSRSQAVHSNVQSHESYTMRPQRRWLPCARTSKRVPATTELPARRAPPCHCERTHVTAAQLLMHPRPGNLHQPHRELWA